MKKFTRVLVFGVIAVIFLIYFWVQDQRPAPAQYKVPEDAEMVPEESRRDSH